MNLFFSFSFTLPRTNFSHRTDFQCTTKRFDISECRLWTDWTTEQRPTLAVTEFPILRERWVFIEKLELLRTTFSSWNFRFLAVLTFYCERGREPLRREKMLKLHCRCTLIIRVEDVKWAEIFANSSSNVTESRCHLASHIHFKLTDHLQLATN